MEERKRERMKLAIKGKRSVRYVCVSSSFQTAKGVHLKICLIYWNNCIFQFKTLSFVSFLSHNEIHVNKKLPCSQINLFP